MNKKNPCIYVLSYALVYSLNFFLPRLPMSMDEMVLLVDSTDRVKGTMDKLAAHQEGKLHRAYSVFLFNSKGELLLQRRSHNKYHSGGLWTNSCCSHPRPGELTHESAMRRLKEELGIVTTVQELYGFVYMCPVGNGLFEYEFDHVFTGKFDGEPKLNPEEVMEVRWVSQEQVLAEIEKEPKQFTMWFQLVCKDVFARMNEPR